MRDKSYIAKGRQISQTSLTTTNATTMYEPPYGVKGSVRVIFVANYGASDCSVSIYQDADGNTASNATALFAAIGIPAGTTDVIDIPEPGIVVDGTINGTLIAKAGTANLVTVTCYGEEVTA